MLISITPTQVINSPAPAAGSGSAHPQPLAGMDDVRVGDVVPMGPGGRGLRVKDFVRGEWLLWWDGIGYSTWLWSLERIAPGQTRLVTRVRTHYRWTHPTILFALLLLEPWDFPMMRKCMLGIKQRVESASERAQSASLVAGQQ